jgi:hypothetical protein
LPLVAAAAIAAGALLLALPWIWVAMFGGPAATGAASSSLPSPVPPADPQPPTPEFKDQPGNALLAAAQKLELPENRAFQTVDSFPEQDMLQLVADDIQLVQLGELAPSTGKISLELQVTTVQGDAGVFLGYRERVDGSKHWSEAHFLHLQMLPTATEKPFLFVREQARIDPGNPALLSLVARREQLGPRPSKSFKLEISFTSEGIDAITLDDKPFPQMLITTYSQQFDPQSIWGPWGLYNHGSTIRVFQPTLIQEPPHALDDSQSSGNDLRP